MWSKPKMLLKIWDASSNLIRLEGLVRCWSSIATVTVGVRQTVDSLTLSVIVMLSVSKVGVWKDSSGWLQADGASTAVVLEWPRTQESGRETVSNEVGPTVGESSLWMEGTPSCGCEGELDTAIVAVRLDAGSKVGKIFGSPPNDWRLTTDASRTPDSRI